MSIGWVVFWKAVVLAVWVALTERWMAFRKRRKAEGLPLRLNRKTQTYIVSDWTEQVERTAYWAKNAAIGAVWTLWAVLGGLYLWGGRDAVKRLADLLLS